MKIVIEYGHTLEEWKKYFNGYDYWDFPAYELFNGAIEPQKDFTYWFIDGRLYEANE